MRLARLTPMLIAGGPWRTCRNVRCAEPFLPKHKAQVFCCTKCRVNFQSLRWHQARRKELKVERSYQCGWCAKVFIKTTDSRRPGTRFRFCTETCKRRSTERNARVRRYLKRHGWYEELPGLWALPNEQPMLFEAAMKHSGYPRRKKQHDSQDSTPPQREHRA